MSETNALIKSWICGPLGVNCYLVGSMEAKEVILIDPGGCVEEIARFLEQKGLVPRLIIATHGHLDHIAAIPDLRKRWDVEVACHPNDFPCFMNPDPEIGAFLGQGFKPFTPDKGLEHGDTLSAGPFTFEIIYTPGHTPGSICLLSRPYLFSGDTLFKAGIGRTDFPGGDYEALMDSLQNRLWTLPDDLILLPGHGESSTIGDEKGFYGGW